MIDEIKKKVSSGEYDFLRTNEHLGKNIILLGLVVVMPMALM